MGAKNIKAPPEEQRILMCHLRPIITTGVLPLSHRDLQRQRQKETRGQTYHITLQHSKMKENWKKCDTTRR